MKLSELGSMGLLGLSEEAKKAAAWNNVAPATAAFAVDCDGRMISCAEYGKLTEYGWEIDHVHPIGLGGPDHILNVRARHWRGNRSAGGLLGGLMSLGRNL
jgi:hypothetical protein